MFVVGSVKVGVGGKGDNRLVGPEVITTFLYHHKSAKVSRRGSSAAQPLDDHPKTPPHGIVTIRNQ